MMNQYKERDEFYIDMGFRLKQIRQIKKVSQNDLADALGVVMQTIQKYESGEVKMSPEIIQKCASFFKVSVGYFYGEEHTNKKYTRVSLMIASEVMMLPSQEIQKSLYALIKSITAISEQDNRE